MTTETKEEKATLPVIPNSKGQPYEWEKCTRQVVIYIPPGGNKAVVSARTHEDAPIVASVDVVEGALDPQVVGLAIAGVLGKLKDELPARGQKAAEKAAEEKAKKDQEEAARKKREEERKNKTVTKASPAAETKKKAAAPKKVKAAKPTADDKLAATATNAEQFAGTGVKAEASKSEPARITVKSAPPVQPPPKESAKPEQAKPEQAKPEPVKISIKTSTPAPEPIKIAAPEPAKVEAEEPPPVTDGQASLF